MSKKILIIGASSGIGRRMAEVYASSGNKVGISARRSELLNELQRIYPSNIFTECFDVTADNKIQHMQSLVNKTGGMDILVISAGTGEPSVDLKWEIDKSIVDTNVNGFIEIANWGFNFFVSQGSGQLVTISSIAANRGSSYSPAYAASKSFQSTYFEGLFIKAKKLKRDVAVTCIEPGFVRTKMAKGGDKMFWIVPVDKAVRQIMNGIQKKRRKVYVSKRWLIIAKLMKYMPFFIYKRIG